jgi:hypothetical protein
MAWKNSGHQERKLFDRVKREEDVCAMPVCLASSRWIDKELQSPHEWSFSVDHIEPRSRRPDLAYVRENLRAAHRRCNQSGQPSKRRPSVDW